MHHSRINRNKRTKANFAEPSFSILDRSKFHFEIRPKIIHKHATLIYPQKIYSQRKNCSQFQKLTKTKSNTLSKNLSPQPQKIIYKKMMHRVE